MSSNEPNGWLLFQDAHTVADGLGDVGRRFLYDQAMLVGDCDVCGGPLSDGDMVVWFPRHRQMVCHRCAGGEGD